MNSWHWVFLSDFAPFKPARLPGDNPADFSFFFDAGERRRCYVAPERFSDGEAADFDVPVAAAADVFSLGCCVAELYMEGKALFDLGALLRYRAGTEDRRAETLATVRQRHPEVARMVLHMTQREPAARLSAAEYLAEWSPRCFPRYFGETLHAFASDMLLVDANRRVEMVQQAMPTLEAAFVAEEGICESQGTKGADVSHASATSHAGGELVAEKDADLVRGVARLLSDEAATAHDGTSGDDEEGAAAWGPDGPDSDDAPSASVGSQPIAQAASASMEEIVADEVWEHQRRRADGTWFEVDPGMLGSEPAAVTADGSEPLSAHAPASWRRLMRQLPEKGGWHWQDEAWVPGEWEHRTMSSASRASMPALVGVSKADARDAESSSAASRGWVLGEESSGAERRRRWSRRRRRRRVVGDATSSQPGAQQKPPAASELCSSRARAPCAGASIITAVLCSALRGATRASHRRAALRMLVHLAPLLDDDTRLQRVMPYVLSLVPDPSPAVRSAAVEALADVAMLVRSFPTSEAKAFPEYVLPALSLLPADSEASVRASYAVHLARIATAADNFLARAQLAATQKSGGAGEGGGDEAGALSKDDRNAGIDAVGPDTAGGGNGEDTFDEERIALRGEIEQAVQELAAPTDARPGDAARNAALDVAAVRRAVLRAAPVLCGALGRHHCAGFLLPVLITFLNDRDWQLRAAFFDEAADVGVAAGGPAVEQFLLPCVENTLCDPEEAVAAAALRCLARMISGPAAPLRRRATLGAARRVAPLLAHPSASVAAAARAAFAAAAEAVGPADRQATLLPALLPVLHYPALDMASESALLEASKPRVKREQLEAMVEAAAAEMQISTPTPASMRVAAAIDPEVRAALSDHAARRARRLLAGGSGAASAAAAAASSRAAAAAAAPPPLAALGLLPLEPTREGRGVAGPSAAQYHLADPPPPGADAGKDDDAADVSATSGADSQAAPLRHAAIGASAAQLTPSDMRRSAAAFEAQMATSPPITLNPAALRQGAGKGAVGAVSPASSMHERERARHGAGALPRPSHAPSARVMPVAPVLSPSGSGPAGWRPRGVLLAHLAEHSAAVTAIACAHEGAFFATASRDGTVKVWDKRRVEKDVSFRSRLTYSDAAHAGAGMTALVALPEHRLAATATDGRLRIFNVSYSPARRGQGVAEQYSGMVERVVEPAENAGAALAVAAPPPGAVAAAGGAGALVLWSTQAGRVHALDPRTARNAFSLEAPRAEGPLEHLALDPSGCWLAAAGNARVSLWDLRFQVRMVATSDALLLLTTL